MGEIIFHGFLMAVLGAFYQQTTLINKARMTDPIGPAGFPQGMIIIAFILVTVSLINTIKKYRKEPKKEGGKIQELDKGFLLLFGSIILFVLLVNYLGFLFSAALLICSILVILGQRKPQRVVAFTIIASLTFTLVFGRLLSVPLPRGIMFFESVSHILY